MQDFISVFW